MRNTSKYILRIALVAVSLFIGNTEIWGSEYHARLTVYVSSGSTGSGKVYASTSNNPFSEDPEKPTEATSGDVGKNNYATLYGKAIPDNGSHFVGWSAEDGATTPKEGTDNPKGFSLQATIKNDITNYYRYAIFALNYYASVTANTTSGASGSPKVVCDSGAYGVPSSSDKVQFTLTAPNAATNYHFIGWTGENITFGSSGLLETTASVLPSDEEGPDKAKKYTATANYAENIYYAKLTAQGDAYGSASVTGDATKSTKTKGGGVVFNISATAIPGYHFKEWTTGGAGTFGEIDNPSTTFTAPASDSYDEGNAREYTVTATFAKDQYKAELITAISEISEEKAVSTAQVSSTGTDWGTSAVKALEAAGKATFYVKATAAEGFKFAGWSKEQSSGTVIEGLGAEGEYEVQTASTEGGTNTETIYAIFKRQYDIVINTSLMDYGANNDRIIFDVTGPETYRVSVPVKGSLRITDVAKGTYTVTPVSAWCWKYNFDSASKEITCDAESVNTVTFNATKKITSKKSDENHDTISY